MRMFAMPHHWPINLDFNSHYLQVKLFDNVML